MSLTNPNTPVSQQDLQDFYNKIKPYMGIYPSSMGQRVGKSDIYSTSEKMIGQWIDGKPLYQRVLEFGEIATGAFPITDISSWNIDQIVKMDGLWLRKDAPCWYNFTGVDNQTKGVCVVYGDHTGGTYIYNASNYVVAKAYVFYQYTKTTDSAISIGDETDYSTEEKIIGTWLNGEPLWQKTVDFGYLPNNTTKTVPHGISNMDRVVHYDFIWTNPSTHDFAETNGVFSTTSQDAVSAWVDRTNITVVTHMDRSEFPAYCTIQYTKSNS